MPGVPGLGRAEGEQVAQKAPERLEEDRVVAVRRTGQACTWLSAGGKGKKAEPGRASCGSSHGPTGVGGGS